MMRALLKDNIAEALIGLVVLVIGVWFITCAYDRTEGARSGSGYVVTARFPNVSGVSVGTDVQLSGIKVGTVISEKLDPATYQAILSISIDNGIKLPVDSSAAITSEGILGGNYVRLSPGGETDMLRAGDEISDTQGSVDLMSLIGSFVNQTKDPVKEDEAAQ
jgi:phospholipid/cholesterol/gamma-HCH transport system substrate-binding protein